MSHHFSQIFIYLKVCSTGHVRLVTFKKGSMLFAIAITSYFRIPCGWVSFHTFLYKYKNHTHFPLIKNQSRVELETHLQIAYIAHCKWWDEVREEGSSLYIQNPYRISFANSIIIGKSLLTECNRSTIHVFKSSHI